MQCKCRIHLLFVHSVYGTGCLGKMMSTLNDTLHQLTLHQHTLHRPTFTLQQMTSTQVNVCKSWCLQYISYTSLIRHFWPAKSSLYFRSSFSLQQILYSSVLRYCKRTTCTILSIIKIMTGLWFKMNNSDTRIQDRLFWMATCHDLFTTNISSNTLASVLALGNWLRLTT